MKSLATYDQITTRMHRATMREQAMRYRQSIHPDAFNFSKFSFNTATALHCLRLAISYREMSRRAA